MTHKEFMALRPGMMVEIDGAFIGQISRVLRYRAGDLLRIGRQRRGAVKVRHDARELEIVYTNNEQRRSTAYFLVYIGLGENVSSNAGTLARLKLWKGE